jgi:hypothetical protein
VILRWFNARIINPQFFAQALRRCLVQFPVGLLAGVTVPVGLRRKRSLRACLERSIIGCEPPYHQLDHGDSNPRFGGFGQGLEVLA